jgi:hypothetical protein
VKPPHQRIRCPNCRFIRVHFRESLCRRCWTDSQPVYRVVRLKGGVTRHIASSHLAKQIGRSKGAETLHATGKAYRWTPATARAAALKMWRLSPRNKRIGVRLARPAKRRPAVNHAALRAIFTDAALHDVCYEKASRTSGPGVWRVKTSTGSRVISERAAFVRLGYRHNPRGFVPRNVDPIGTVYATKPRH